MILLNLLPWWVYALTFGFSLLVGGGAYVYLMAPYWEIMEDGYTISLQLHVSQFRGEQIRAQMPGMQATLSEPVPDWVPICGFAGIVGALVSALMLLFKMAVALTVAVRPFL